jgi:hypothetical protein
MLAFGRFYWTSLQNVTYNLPRVAYMIWTPDGFNATEVKSFTASSAGERTEELRPDERCNKQVFDEVPFLDV